VKSKLFSKMGRVQKEMVLEYLEERNVKSSYKFLIKEKKCQLKT